MTPLVARTTGSLASLALLALLLLQATGSHASPPDSLDRIPLEPPYYVISSRFGWRYGVLHPGIDLVTPVRRPIVAASAGIVERAGWMGRLGWAVVVRHPGNLRTVYAHMVETPPVSQGQEVALGETLGLVGSTGTSTGPHLHFEVRRGSEPVNPELFLHFHGPEDGRGAGCDHRALARGERRPDPLPEVRAPRAGGRE